jgi:hypothetical protein
VKSSLDERTQGWVSVQLLELMDGVVADVADFAKRSGS